ncbi:MAG TPA: PilZ domain-containing protein [Anaerohalosphaeraceae bacterium]|nr:PilZ domain-containing protein [Anaerohalosphaeraceae bacterium]
MQMEERRKSVRYKAREDVRAAISAEDSDLHTEGFVLNISQSGAYIFANAIPFQNGILTFRLPDGRTIQRRCRRIDPYQPRARGQAVAFTDALTAEELEALKAPILE